MRLCVTPTDCSPPETTGFSRQEHFRGLPCPSPGDLPNPGIQPRSPALQVDSLPSEPMEAREAHEYWSGQPALPRGSSQSRNRTRVSCMAGRFFTNRVSRVAPLTVSSWKHNRLNMPETDSKFLLLFCPPFLSPSSPSHLTHACFHL